MSIVALSKIQRKWKQSRYLLIDKFIIKTLFNYTMEYYSAAKKNVVRKSVGERMELSIIILSDVTRSRKTNITCILHLSILVLNHLICVLH